MQRGDAGGDLTRSLACWTPHGLAENLWGETQDKESMGYMSTGGCYSVVTSMAILKSYAVVLSKFAVRALNVHILL